MPSMLIPLLTNTIIIQDARRLEAKETDRIFSSTEDAWKFWIGYGGRVRFGLRKQHTRKKKDGSVDVVGLFVAEKACISQTNEIIR